LYKNNKHALLLTVYDSRDNQHLIGSFSSSSPPPLDAIDSAFHDGRLLNIFYFFLLRLLRRRIKVSISFDQSAGLAPSTHFQKMLIKLFPFYGELSLAD
jgi:hypothetical protein